VTTALAQASALVIAIGLSGPLAVAQDVPGHDGDPSDVPAGAALHYSFMADDGQAVTQGSGGGVVQVVTAPADRGPTQKVAYLGIVASPVPRQTDAVQQRGLPEGVGLVVQHVQPGSPAASAGLAPSDVLQKFNDQLLVTTAQLSVLVRLQKPGDDVTLTVVRDGQEQKLKARLGEQQIIAVPAGTGQVAFQVDLPHWSYARTDAEHTIRIANDGTGTKVTVTDKAGQPVFDGPCDSDQQRAVMPPGIRAKVEEMLLNRPRATISMQPGAHAASVPPGKGPKAHVSATAVIESAVPPAPNPLAAKPGAGPIDAASPGARRPPVRYFDGQKWFLLTVRDGQKHLVIQDPQGREVFSAPVAREEQRQQLAKEVLDKLRFMETTVAKRSAAIASPQVPPPAERPKSPGQAVQPPPK
jgi:hypothetical protein